MIYKKKKIHPTNHDKTFSASGKTKITVQKKKWVSNFFITNLVIQIDGSFQQFTTLIYQNIPSELLIITLVFHIEICLLGLQIF